MANSNADFPNQLQRDKDIMALDFYNAVQKGSEEIGELTQKRGNLMVTQGKVFANKYNIKGQSMYGNTIGVPKQTTKYGKDWYYISVAVSNGWLAMMDRSVYQMRKPKKGALKGRVVKGSQENYELLESKNRQNVKRKIDELKNKRY